MIIGPRWQMPATAAAIAAAILLAGCDDKEAAKPQPAPPVAEAPKVDAKAAQQQAAEIRQAVDNYLALSAGPTNLRNLTYSGVAVTPVADGAGFDVVVEALRIGSAEAGFLDVGTIRYRLTPKGSDGYTVSELRHADTMAFTDGAGGDLGTLTVRTTAFAGEWSTPLQNFTALDWRIANLDAAGTSMDRGSLHVDEGTVQVTTVNAGNDRVDQTTRLTLNRVAVKDDSGGVAGVDRVTLDGTVNGFRMQEYLPQVRAAQARLKTLTAAADAAKAPSAPAPAADPEQLKILGELYLSALRMIGAVDSRLAVEGLAYTATDGTQPFRLAAAGFDTRIADLGSEQATAGLKLTLRGLAVEAPGISDDPLAGPLLPRTATVDVELTGVPARAIAEALLGDLGRLTTEADDVRQAAADAVGATVNELLQRSSMQLVVRPSTIASDNAAIGAGGRFAVDPDAGAGIVGSLDVTVAGLDAVLAAAEGAAATSPDAAGMAELLTALKAQAERGRRDDGSFVDRFRIDIDAEGQITVNGLPLGSL